MDRPHSGGIRMHFGKPGPKAGSVFCRLETGRFHTGAGITKPRATEAHNTPGREVIANAIRLSAGARDINGCASQISCALVGNTPPTFA